MFQLPALVLSFILASAYATLFYSWQSRGVRILLFFWLASVAGFALGQAVGVKLHLIPWMIGQVHIAEATAGSFLVLLAANWLRPQGKQP